MNAAVATWVGGLLIEFLKTRFRGGAPDALRRLTRALERAPSADAFAPAFAAELGAPLAEAEEAYAAYLEATQADPAERFRGTIFAPFAAPAAAPR